VTLLGDSALQRYGRISILPESLATSGFHAKYQLPFCLEILPVGSAEAPN
jgi:hypothetical protein